MKSFHLIVLISTLIFSSIFLKCYANTSSDVSAFKNAYANHQKLITANKYKEALPFAKEAYELAKKLFEPQNNNRIVVTDNYALNLQETKNLVMAREIFIEILSLYEAKYGKHAPELLPILTDITVLDKELGDKVDLEDAKEYGIRRYKLYLRHNSDEFVEQFADKKLPTTIHSKNTEKKLESHFDKSFDIYESEHWSIIYPPKKSKFVEKKLAKLMEQTYQNNISFLVSMGLRNKPIDEKMTAVYLENRDDYISYIKAITKDSYTSKASGGIYSHKARAIFIFGYDKEQQSKRQRPKASTVVHQVSYQVLYSTGFFSFDYIQPRWLTAGTAVCFEYHTRKKPFGPHTKNYAFKRISPIKERTKNSSLISLTDLVTFDGDDESFNTKQNQSDIYALGSLLVRFLYSYYPDEFKDYLKVLSKSRTTHYERAKFGKNVRLKQFKKAFGDPTLLQAQFNVYLEQVFDETDIAFAEFQAKKKAKRKKKSNS